MKKLCSPTPIVAVDAPTLCPSDAQSPSSHRSARSTSLAPLRSPGSCFVVLLILLGISARCSAQAMNGHWVNVDPKSQGVAKIDIQGTQVCWRGCERGTIATTPTGPVLRVEFKPASATSSVEASLTPDGRLSVKVHTHYTDASNRNDHDTVDFLKRAPLPASASAQASSPQPPPPPDNVADADIFKMVRAGLPEQVVLAKIREGVGHWDASVDALIALKKSGATDAELAAMNAPPPPVAPPAPVAAPQPVSLFGGILHRTPAGDPYIKFPEKVRTVFPNGDASNTAFLVSYEGKPAIRIPAQHIDVACTDGNLLITSEAVIFNPYLYENSNAACFGDTDIPRTMIVKPKDRKVGDRVAFRFARGDVHLNYRALDDVSVFSPKNSFPFEHATYFTPSKGPAYTVGAHFTAGIGCYPGTDCLSSELETFLQALIDNFDGTMASILKTTGMQQADKQLSPDAHYQLITFDEWPKYAGMFQKQLDRMPRTKGPSGWAAFAEVAQIASAGATALQQSSAGGNTIEAQEAAQAQYNNTVAAIESGNPPPPAPPSSIPADTPRATPPPQPVNTAPTAKSAFNMNKNPKPPAQPATHASTGTVAPANCVAVNVDEPCIPLAQWTQMQAARQAPPPVQLCPASGFIPGVMRQSGDTAVGVQCTPGQPINGNASGSGTTSASGTGSGSSGSGSGSTGGSAGSGNGDQVTSPVPDCVYESYPNGDWTFTNRCNAPVYVQWIVGTYSGSWTIAPGDHTGTGFSGAQVASQDPSYYVCPATYSPKDPSGHTLTHPVPQYHCARNGAF